MWSFGECNGTGSEQPLIFCRVLVVSLFLRQWSMPWLLWYVKITEIVFGLRADGSQEWWWVWHLWQDRNSVFAVYVQAKMSWALLEQLIEITTYWFSLCVGNKPLKHILFIPSTLGVPAVKHSAFVIFVNWVVYHVKRYLNPITNTKIIPALSYSNAVGS